MASAFPTSITWISSPAGSGSDPPKPERRNIWFQKARPGPLTDQSRIAATARVSRNFPGLRGLGSLGRERLARWAGR